MNDTGFPEAAKILFSFIYAVDLKKTIYLLVSGYECMNVCALHVCLVPVKAGRLFYSLATKLGWE